MIGGTQNGTGNQFLESVLPGISGLTSTATGDIGNLLNGLPSASLARTTNAYWGVGAGTPAGGPSNAGDINTFIGQRGADLYNQQAQANKNQGLQQLLQTLNAYAAPYLSNQGQQMQNAQFGQQLNQQNNQFGADLGFRNRQLNQQGSQFDRQLGMQSSQFDRNYALNQFQAMLSALGLGNSITGQLPGNIQI